MNRPLPFPAQRARRGQKGLTLLEILVVLAILVLLIGVSVAGLGRLGANRLRSETNKLSAAVRYTFNRATAHGLYMRMVIDLDTEEYKVEASAEPMFLAAAKREQGDDPDAPTEAEVKEAEKAERRDDDAPAPLRTTRTRYQEDGVISPVKMEGGSGIDSILTSGQKDVFSSGKAYLHFFPNGWVEPAYIWTTDGEGTYYTLAISPLTGRVTSMPGKVDAPREFADPEQVEKESE